MITTPAEAARLVTAAFAANQPQVARKAIDAYRQTFEHAIREENATAFHELAGNPVAISCASWKARCEAAGEVLAAATLAAEYDLNSDYAAMVGDLITVTRVPGGRWTVGLEDDGVYWRVVARNQVGSTLTILTTVDQHFAASVGDQWARGACTLVGSYRRAEWVGIRQQSQAVAA